MVSCTFLIYDLLSIVLKLVFAAIIHWNIFMATMNDSEKITERPAATNSFLLLIPQAMNGCICCNLRSVPFFYIKIDNLIFKYQIQWNWGENCDALGRKRRLELHRVWVRINYNEKKMIFNKKIEILTLEDSILLFCFGWGNMDGKNSLETLCKGGKSLFLHA